MQLSDELLRFPILVARGKFDVEKQLLDYAKEIVKRVGVDPKKLVAELAKYDESVAAQAASLCQATGRDVRSAEVEEALKTALQHVKRGFAAYANTQQK